MTVKDYIRSTKHMVPCADCGVAHPYWRMVHDHRPGEEKLFNLSRAGRRHHGDDKGGDARGRRTDSGRFLIRQATMEEAVTEVAKCDVVCLLCHADRGHSRAEQARALSGKPFLCGQVCSLQLQV